VTKILVARTSRKIKYAIALNLLWQLIPIIAALFSVPYIISLFGKELFSVYALAVAYIVGLNYLHMGVATNVNRDLAATEIGDLKGHAEIFWTGLIAMGVISLFIVAMFLWPISAYVGSLSADFIDETIDIEQFFRLVVYQSPLVMLLIYFRAVLESSLKFSITALNRALLNTALLCAPLLALWLNMPFQSIPFLFLSFHLISLGYLAFSCRHYLTMPLPIFRLKAFAEMLKTGSSLTFISLAMLIFLYCDRYILSANDDLEQVAYFLAPFDVLARTSFIYGSIGAVFFPVFAKLYSKSNHAEFMKMYSACYWLIFSIVGFVTYIVIAFSGDLLSLWLGDDFRDKSVPIMNILVMGILFTGLSTVPSRALIALRQELVLGYAYIGAGVLYLGFSFVLISHYGAVGAAYAFLTRSIVELAFLNSLLSYKSKRLMAATCYDYAKASRFFAAPFVLLLALLVIDLSLLVRITVSLSLLMLGFVFVLRMGLWSRIKGNGIGLQ